MRYRVIVTFDPEYDGYVIDAPDLPGCMSQGKTLDEALANMKDAIRGWILVEQKHGRQLPIESKDVFLGEVTV